MLRALIATGLLLMTVGFGASGWQYWKSLPRTEAAATHQTPADVTEPVRAALRQTWLISPTGGLVPQDSVRAYLVQDRFVPSRTVRLVRQASLGSLLAEGEKLPDAPFLQVLADIRAPRVADGLCAVLMQSFAQDCAVNAARVVEGSVDPVAGTALFQLELVYRLNDSNDELPDLAAHVLHSDVVRIDLEAGSTDAATPDLALQAALSAVVQACSAEGVGQACRPLGLNLDWAPGKPVTAQAEIAWLDALPAGMFVAPPLDTVPGG